MESIYSNKLLFEIKTHQESQKFSEYELLIYEYKQNEDLKLLGKIVILYQCTKFNIIYYSSSKSRFNKLTRDATIYLINYIFENSDLKQVSNSHIKLNKNETIEQFNEFYQSCGFGIIIHDEKNNKFNSICTKDHFYQKLSKITKSTSKNTNILIDGTNQTEDLFSQIQDRQRRCSQFSIESENSSNSQTSTKSTYSPLELAAAEALVTLFKKESKSA